MKQSPHRCSHRISDSQSKRNDFHAYMSPASVFFLFNCYAMLLNKSCVGLRHRPMDLVKRRYTRKGGRRGGKESGERVSSGGKEGERGGGQGGRAGRGGAYNE